MTPSELDAFVEHNHWLMTMPDMEQETGLTLHYIRKSFKRMGLKPKTPLEIKIKFIQNYHDILTRKQTIRMLDIADNYLLTLCHEAGVSMDSFKKEEVKNIVTPRQVFSDFQIEEANHYNNTQREHDIWDRIVENIKQA